MRNLILLLFVYLSFIAVQAQTESIIVNGIITDQQGAPLPYANVSFANKLRGTVCNSVGEFKILIPLKYQNDSLNFSFLGFEPQTIPINSIQNRRVKVKLKVSPLALKEAVVTSYTGLFLINKAIEKIPENYLSKPYISKGFYRVVTNKAEEYIHLSEAVFDVFQSEKASLKKPFRLDKMRAIKDESAAHGMTVGQSPRTLLSSDIINGREDSELLSKKGIKNHNFFLEGMINYNGQSAYKISFKKKPESKKMGLSGHLYLDEKSLAFLYVETKVEEEDLHLVKMGTASVRVMLKLMDIQIDLLASESKIYYKKIGDQYFLNTVFINSKMSMKSGRNNFDFKLDSKMNYVVTEIDLDNPKPFPNEETLGMGKFIEFQNSQYDSTFWKNYTIILPEQDFGKIAKSINLKNEGHDHKLAVANVIFKYDKQKDIRVDSILSYYNRKGLFNGNALVALDNEVIFEKSYNNGVTKNKMESQFRIGSTSKTFTSALIMLLRKEGKLKLNDPIEKYLPDYRYGKATIEQLLTHQSGIPDYLNDGLQLEQLYKRSYPVDELVTKFCSDTLEFAHGLKFDYSNSGYVLLAAIIEKITNQSFKDVLNEKIFIPLGMKDTYFGKPGDTKNLSMGYLFSKPEPNFPVLNTIGAGGITSTTRDLLKWSLSLENETLLSKDELSAIWQPRAEYKDWNATYGYGWMIDKSQFDVSKKHKVVLHPGTDNGFNSMFLKQPDKGITIVLLNNTGAFPRFDISDLILDEMDR